MAAYSPSDYLNPGKIWDIATAPGGVVFMAADRGLLEYDGSQWRRFRGSDGFLRSVLVKSDSLIYTGSDLDFGRWVRSGDGNWEYTSLYPFRDELAGLAEEFWGVYEHNGFLYFVSASNLYVYRNQNLTKIVAPDRFSGSFFFEEALWLVDETQGLIRVTEFALQQLAPFPESGPQEIIGMFRDNNNLRLVTRESGLLSYRDRTIEPLNSPLAAELSEAGVFSYEAISDSVHAFGTIQNGLIIADAGGRVLHRINRNKGLLNNTVLSLHYSRYGKLWAGLDFGLNTFDLRSNYSFFYDLQGAFGTGYAALLHDETFYLGTNTGFYRTTWDNLSGSQLSPGFQPVPGLSGQVWSIHQIGGDILIAHDRGLFLYRDDTAVRLNAGRGVWTLVPFRSKLLAGTYNGISVFSREAETWTFTKQLEHIFGSVIQLVPESDEWLWVNIPNFGMVRTRLNDELLPVDRLLYPIADFEGDDAKIVVEGEDLFVLTSRFRYRYDFDTEQFEVAVPEYHLHLPCEVVPGVFAPLMLNDQWQFYPVSNGFMIEDLSREMDPAQFNTNFELRQSQIFSYQEERFWEPDDRIPSGLNNVRFRVLIPNESAMRYQYRLHTTQEWSVPQASDTIELVGLTRGRHELEIRAVMGGEIFAEKNFTLHVAPPWYLSWYMLLLLVLLFIAAWIIARRWHREILIDQKREMLRRQQQEMKKQAAHQRQAMLEKEQLRLRGELEKLERNLKSKTLELANRAKKGQDKNRILQDIKEKIDALEATSQVSKRRIVEIDKMLDSCIDLDDNTFEIQMNELHQEFFRKMKERFPDLSGNDLRLCAYVKLGFSAKEIADMLQIQPSSVYISRSRLRKKLNLDTEEDLYGFLNGIE
ncbi:hypothetical protein CYPRO_1477 [Cyclonatronum proteinivorum]|uniref:HTH luxR-type domain-containing protein n=1 Tax=Cyclonatronum proteinivorum TaxID=1457365 RepID=A0A345UJT1_9BACT|nr:hypothetical protein [Cyclonatronum proteinivorum]AXJ00733.1 hypothetical protein CYPRO_1477 [Cyclonatronum proteinivorum]